MKSIHTPGALTLLLVAGAPSLALGGAVHELGRCGTPQLLKRVPGRVLVPGMARPTCEENPRPTYDAEKVYDDPTYGFRIHYTTDNGDSRSVTEAQVQQTAAVMRDVMDAEQDTLNYNPPPNDEADAELFCDEGFGGDGGTAGYDIYFVDEDDVYGYAQPMTLVDGERQGSSFLALSTWILDYDGALEVTVAHEFFHAIQFGYDVFEDSFWMENTAVWMEEQVYDSVNDYLNYVPEAMSNPDEPLDSDDSIMYAHGIWPLYFSQTIGQDGVQRIWEECAAGAEGNALAAQEVVLNDEYPGGWAQALLDFRGAMYNLGEFEEGDKYPSVTAQELFSSFPVSFDGTVKHTAAEILYFQTSTPGTLNLCYTGGTDEAIAKVFVKSGSEKTEVALDGAPNAGKVTVEDFGGDIKQVALVVTHAFKSGSSDFHVDATVGSAQCEPGTPGGPSTGEEESPTPIYICGGCLEVTPAEKEGEDRAAAGILGMLMTAGLIFWRRRS